MLNKASSDIDKSHELILSCNKFPHPFPLSNGAVDDCSEREKVAENANRQPIMFASILLMSCSLYASLAIGCAIMS